MEIRPAEKEDASNIIGLVAEIWAEYDCVLDAENEDKYLLAPGEYFRSRGGNFWIVAEKDEIIATVGIMMLDDETAELKSLYVHKNFRKQGLGKRLVELVINFARRKKAKKLALWSDTRFGKAHRLYERMNFERCGRRELDDLNNSTEFGFEKSLTD